MIKESGTEIGNSLEFDFVVDNPKTIERLGLLSQPLFCRFLLDKRCKGDYTIFEK